MKNKIVLVATSLLLASTLNAEGIRPLLSVELGFEGGSVDNDYSAAGFVPESYEHDYSGMGFRLAGGIAIEHETLESRIKLYLESGSGEVEFDPRFNLLDEDYDSTEIGFSYDLVFSSDEIEPFIGIEIGAGSSEFDVPGAEESDYTSFGLYGGLLVPINENLDFSARIGFKSRNYDDYSEFVSGIGIITEETSYSGLDLKVGLTYVF